MNPAKRLDWSPKKRAIAVTLRKEGYSYREIASKIGQGVTPAGVLKLCKRFTETGSVQTKQGRGRKKTTTTLTDRRIVRLALRNRKSSAVDINKELVDADVKISGPNCSPQVGYGRLAGKNSSQKAILEFCATLQTSTVGQEACQLDHRPVEECSVE